MNLPLNDGTEWQPPEHWLRQITACSHADVPAELKKMRLWLLGNPARRKTRRGIKTFITSWLLRAAAKPAPARVSEVSTCCQCPQRGSQRLAGTWYCDAHHAEAAAYLDRVRPA